MHKTKFLVGITASAVFILGAMLAPVAVAKSDEVKTQRYVIEFRDPPLAAYDGRALALDGRRLEATSARLTGKTRLDPRSPQSLDYLQYLEGRHLAFREETERQTGRSVRPIAQMRLATNGMVMDLSDDEIEQLAQSPMVKSVTRDFLLHRTTDRGPLWIGAGPLWDGAAGFMASEGEGVIVAGIDGGINWDHLSFASPSPDGYVFTNPLGQYLGLCDDPEVDCNDKLIGVYDFIEDDPSTEDVVEENTKGKDNDGHGSHTISTMAGNRVNPVLSGGRTNLSGVAPRANIISYRACYIGEPPDPDGGGCPFSASLQAIDQAIADGVDVINYSLGSESFSPWTNGSTMRAMLNARDAGIFIATSAGNSGPGESTMGSPANAPWVMAVGRGTHDRVEGSLIENMSGGETPAPGDMLGVSETGGIGVRKIVHARDFGNALCGTGEAQSGSICATNTGLSNPWNGETPFNGEIVVCDRGTYGRVEKGKNVLLAGAGGMILANTDAQGESIVADNHCLPAVHVGDTDGDVLRAWLASGSNHMGSLSGSTTTTLESFGDQVALGSSRGPNLSPVEDVLKPNVLAPGTDILAAWYQAQGYVKLSGTSMSSPHVAGGAALLRAVHPDWSVDQLMSAIQMTATDELVKSGAQATPFDAGAGRPQLDLAANAGLYLALGPNDFLNARPGGPVDPVDLNLAGLQDSDCFGDCTFERTVTDMMGGGTWTAEAIGFPADAQVSVTPNMFTLTNGSSQSLSINVDVSDPNLLADWVFGKIRLSANGAPDQYLTVATYSSAGDLPSLVYFQTQENSGWDTFELENMAGLPDATFTSTSLLRPDTIVIDLPQDNDADSPYDNSSGTYTHWHNLPNGAYWVYAQTLVSESKDIDLFVGRDDNGNGKADESEELCQSTSSNDLERCDLYDLQGGNYWVLMQNWDATNASGDEATLVTAGLGPGSEKNMAASGPGMTQFGDSFEVRVSWEDFDAKQGEEFLGAIAVGSKRSSPTDIGVIPVRVRRSAYADPQTFPLMAGRDHTLALNAGATHDRVFIDIPSTAEELTVSVQALEAAHNDGLKLELARLDFSAGLANAPFAASASSATKLATANGSGSQGPSLVVNGSDLAAGRWYAVLTNENDEAVSLSIRADVVSGGNLTPVHWGLWTPSSRPTLGQGYEYAIAGVSRALVWYTYEEDGQPAWYISGAYEEHGDIWVADILRVTNNGAEQHFDVVGSVSKTLISAEDAMFSFRLHGEGGTERMIPLVEQTCPMVNGSEKSYTGLWSRPVAGLGGASVMVNDIAQAQIHYLFDAGGKPRWLFGQSLTDASPTLETLDLLQFHGYCAVCNSADVDFDPVGMLSREFGSETDGSWTLEYELLAPLDGTIDRTDSVIRLTDVLSCQ